MANSQSRFAVTPTVSISRSKFKRFSQHKTSLKIGDIVPIYCDEVLPGDTRRIDIAALVRMNNPTVPLMDNIKMDYYAFFCPNRILWEHWKQFMGENTDSAGAVVFDEYTIPECSADNLAPDSLGAYLGLPVGINGGIAVNQLPLRMYFLIYNEWFRDQNLIDPIYVPVGDDHEGKDYNVDLLKACKDSDYFTRCLPYAQKGAPVTIPLGTSAEVKLKNYSNASGEFYHTLSAVTASGADATGAVSVSNGDFKAGNTSVTFDPNGSWVADLSDATAATINSLRFAFQYQKFLERDALYGTRYWEILKGHFGVSAPDASLQRPELLGHWKQNINIDQVLQTTGSSDDPSVNALGNPGAVSVTCGKSNICSKSFVEHGYIMILAVARHDQTYCQGINRMFTRSLRTDFYDPLFANLGNQPVYTRELYNVSLSNIDWDEVFGFQEAWAEYRYKPSIVSGYLNPTLQASLGNWTLCNNFLEKPTLGPEFIKQNANALHRATIGDVGFDFIADFAFNDISVRPMPLYSTPGLIDHH